MVNGSSTPLIRCVHDLAGTLSADELPDRELVERFVDRGDREAFAALVRRHGSMVLGVCRRIIRHEQDAEDVFQAVFLVLSRKAGKLVRKEAVGSWLFGVAHRLSLKARQKDRQRREREAKIAEARPDNSLDQLTLVEARTVLDEELAALPDRERGPLILCYLEGLTRDQAAKRLGCALGTLKGRLERGRARLEKRLTRRGLSFIALLPTLVLGRESVATTAALQAATVEAATAFAGGPALGHAASANAVVLAETVFKGAVAGKVKIGAAVLLVLAACGLLATMHKATSSAQTQNEPRRTPAVEPPEVRVPPVPAMADKGRETIPSLRERNVTNGPDSSADWPQWRGPSRDGVVRGVKVPESWPKSLTEEWKVEIGPGVASPVVVGGRAYVFARTQDDEFVACLDVADGKEVWRSESYVARYKPGSGEGTAENRPRSTPAVADGRIFTLGMTGILSCLEAATGKLLWRKDTKYSPYGGSSPLVVDGLCIASVGDGKTGGLTAFDVRSGDEKWCFKSESMSGSPILVDLLGERHLTTYWAWNAAGVSLASGKKLWGVGPGGAGMPCTTPVQYKDLIILADNLAPLRALRLEKGDRGITAKEVWKANNNLRLYYSSPVIADDLVFCHSTRNGGCFFCLDARTGKTCWETDGREGGYASILNLGNVLLFLTDRGRLVVVKTTAAKYEPIAEYQLPGGNTEAHPVFLGDRILIKDQTALRSFRFKPDVK
jgi:RNA polymerase sigma factor (sigma-70 family)